MIRFILSIVGGVYLGIGLLGGLVLMKAIPAMNVFGLLFYAVTWPLFMFTDFTAGHLPIWFLKAMFTFD